MISEIPSPTLAALPVRRRETLEIFDTALKLYRRYFWVLLAWSAIVSLSFLTFYFSTITYLFTTPLLFGAVSCCVAAAVRGQGVGFRQCWEFTKPRYGAMLGALFLSWLIFFAAMIVFYIAIVLLGIGAAFALANAPLPVQVVAGVTGGVLVLCFFSAVAVFAFAWLTMVPIVSCLEDDKRGTPAMGRALELLKGNWRRVFGLSVLLGLAMLAVMGIIAGIYMLFAGVASIGQLFSASDSAIFGLVATLTGFWGLFNVIWTPAQTLIIAVLYLDLRVRREALDLEWTAYTSAPPPLPSDVALETGATGLVELAPGAEVGPTSLAAGGVTDIAAADAPATNAPAPAEAAEFSPTGFAAPAGPPPVPISEIPAAPEPFTSIFPPAPSLFENPIEPTVEPTLQHETPLDPTPETSGENEARRDT